MEGATLRKHKAENASLHEREAKGVTLCERQVALVCERRVHQLGRIALLLVRVFKLCVDHLHDRHAAAVQVVPAEPYTPYM